MLTSLVRAWYYDMDPSFAAPLRTKYGDHVMSKPVLVAPAMNTYMLEQQVTHGHLRTLRDRGVSILDSVVKTLACGDTGKGAMADVAVIVAATVAALDRYEASLAQAASENRPDFVP